jgi:hypothetical protein
MPTALRFLFLLVLGLLGLQPAAYTYDAVDFVSSAEQCAYVSTAHNQVATVESAASEPFCPDRVGVASDSQANLCPTANFIAAENTAGDAVFWSGRQGANKAAAEAFAKSTGGTTLEMTPTGQALTAQGAGIDAWRAASADFARGASGDVTSFAGGSSPGSVWQTVEKPILMQNPNVTRIIIKDAVNTSKTTIIYPH